MPAQATGAFALYTICVRTKGQPTAGVVDFEIPPPKICEVCWLDARTHARTKHFEHAVNQLLDIPGYGWQFSVELVNTVPRFRSLCSPLSHLTTSLRLLVKMFAFSGGMSSTIIRFSPSTKGTLLWVCGHAHSHNCAQQSERAPTPLRRLLALL